MAGQKMKITRIADQVRNIPLREVLERYGFEAKAEGTTLRAKSDHHNIVVTGSKWFDNKAGVTQHFCYDEYENGSMAPPKPHPRVDTKKSNQPRQE
ncbi:MAG TPA: hypothetical protein VMS23_08220 [Terrimicrobiaceae bacterium]|jgi:hypothetical protein|nr:hypothetical protein [Terrimicrobiaceae bacterium]